MNSMTKPHAVCIPLPAQGHINPMLKLAKLLHFKGFCITFVHTEFNARRLLSSLDDLQSSNDFRFETISDGLLPTNERGILDLPELVTKIQVDGQRSFRDLVTKLNHASSSDHHVPAVSCIISDGVMGFTLQVAQEFGIPEMLFFTPSGCGMLGYLHYEDLVERGYFPLKDESQLSNGFLDTAIDWIPAMKGIRLKDLPTFLRTTDSDDTMFNYNLQAVNIAMKAQGVILNTFDELEQEVLDVIKTRFPNLYTIGPLSLLQHHLSATHYLDSIKANLWTEDEKCLDWLDKRPRQSVVYVNYGSLVIMTKEQLAEFAWGLADSKYPFLWVMRPNLVDGGEEIISSLNFMEETKDRALFLEWGPQEKILSHPSVGGFLTHCGWNSTLESICEGVPLICWPFFAEQQTNCFYLCNKWGFGMEIDTQVERDKVEKLVRELMEGDKGKEMRENSTEWKKKAEAATTHGGSSYTNFDVLIKQLKQ
ncbi:7-deoxyloganetin glucosyltransferase-like [Malus sylvestris]|uniref:7-deoxyloganetin glucosyltransferase-like n=1 Tax=Malus sylvestris TaxID=3752 RepID=UPI0021ABFB9D|nr:7-deoxyloganetin glucosyltransferase-like [Malus sylvestris]